MEAKKYKIRWVVNAVRVGKRGKRSISLGFCEKNKKVAFASLLGNNDDYEALKPFVIGDVYTNKECEDGQYCWNVTCPHNRATPKTLEKYLGKNCNSQTFKRVADRLQEIGEHLLSIIDWNKEGQIIFEKAPVIFYFKKDGKK